MSDIISKEYINLILKNIADALDVKKWSYDEETLELKAQNYFGVLIPVVMRGTKNQNDAELSIMLKLAPPDERYRVSGAVTLMFAREIFVYSKVFKIFEELQEQMQLDLQNIKPYCYYVCQEYCNEVIAMKNICKNGYQPYVKSLFLDIDHMIVALKTLAKFHALSMILEYKNSEIFNEVKKVCEPLSEKTNKRYIEVLIDRLDKAIQKFENSTYVTLLKELKSNCVTYINATHLSAEKNCLCHGDIWKENIMFKYENNKPLSACLIDFQTTRICSPALDVLYLIASSTDAELRREYYRTLLDTYYNTLETIFNDSAIDLKNIYNHNQLERDLKIVAPACLIIANTALWLANGLQEEGHVRSKQVLHTANEKSIAVNKYKKIIKGIMDDFEFYGYLTIPMVEEC